MGKIIYFNSKNKNNKLLKKRKELKKIIECRNEYIESLIFKDNEPNKRYNIKNKIYNFNTYNSECEIEFVPNEFMSPKNLYNFIENTKIQVFSNIKYKGFDKMPTRKLIKYNKDKIIKIKEIKQNKRLEEVLNTLLNQLYIVNKLDTEDKIQRVVTNIKPKNKIIIYDKLEHYQIYKNEFRNINISTEFNKIIPKWYKLRNNETEKKIKRKNKIGKQKLKQFLKIRNRNPFEIYQIENVNFDVLIQAKEIVLKLYAKLKY